MRLQRAVRSDASGTVVCTVGASEQHRPSHPHVDAPRMSKSQVDMYADDSKNIDLWTRVISARPRGGAPRDRWSAVRAVNTVYTVTIA